MKKMRIAPIFLLVLVAIALFVGCGRDSATSNDQVLVNKQQEIYQDVQPVHIYDYSIPRDIYQQIYDVTTQEIVATYSIIESITGVTRFECPSMGYPIPSDMSLTNPVQGTNARDTWGADEYSVVIEQPEPSGLYSSKNTDATWVMCVDVGTGEVYPFYTEHKVSTFPFIAEKDEDGQWVRADNKPITFKVTILGTAPSDSPVDDPPVDDPPVDDPPIVE